MSQNKLSLWVHLVWGVKKRKNLITDEVRPILYNKILEVSDFKGYGVVEINGLPDHVHLLLQLNLKYSISEIVKNLKGATSTWLAQQNITDEYFEGQDGYGAFSVSSFMVETVKRYIRNQEEHHAGKDFANEMIYLDGLGKSFDRK